MGERCAWSGHETVETPDRIVECGCGAIVPTVSIPDRDGRQVVIVGAHDVLCRHELYDTEVDMELTVACSLCGRQWPGHVTHGG